MLNKTTQSCYWSKNCLIRFVQYFNTYCSYC